MADHADTPAPDTPAGQAPASPAPPAESAGSLLAGISTVAGVFAEDVLRERAESLALEEAEEVDEHRVSILLFSMGEETYGVRIDEVREIYNDYRVTPVPCVPDSILGVVNIRGEIVSVTDLRALMLLGRTEVDRAADTQPPMIVVAADGVCTALMVDAIGDIVDVGADAIEPPVAGWDKVQTEYVSGAFYTGEKLVALVNLSKVLAPVGGE